MLRVIIKIGDTVCYIQPRIILKYRSDVAMEIDPVFPVEEKDADTDQIRYIFVVVVPVNICKTFRIFTALAYDLFQKVLRVLGAVTIRVDAGFFNIIKVGIDKVLAKISQMLLNRDLRIIDRAKLFPRNAAGTKFFWVDIMFFKKSLLIKHIGSSCSVVIQPLV